MDIFKRIVFALAFLMVGFALFASGVEEEPEHLTFEGSHADTWKLEARNPLLIGGYGDNFVYDGSTVVPLDGTASVDLNAKTNKGSMIVEFNGTITPEAGVSYTGNIRMEYSEFETGSDFWEGGVADFVWLHGDTGQEAPVMPKVRTFLGSWGPVDIFVNDELVYEKLVGHMMYTERSRDPNTYAIYNKDRSGFFSPGNPGDYSIAEPDETEIHFVAHTVEPDSGNFPPHTVWIHLNFVDVELM